MKRRRPQKQADTIIKTVSIPEPLFMSGMSVAIDEGHCNFSRVIREALESYLAQKVG